MKPRRIREQVGEVLGAELQRRHPRRLRFQTTATFHAGFEDTVRPDKRLLFVLSPNPENTELFTAAVLEFPTWVTTAQQGLDAHRLLAENVSYAKGERLCQEFALKWLKWLDSPGLDACKCDEIDAEFEESAARKGSGPYLADLSGRRISSGWRQHSISRDYR